MKIKEHQLGLHFLFILTVLVLLFPLVYALSNSFKTLNDAFNNVFSLIPREFTLQNYIHVFTRLDFMRIVGNTFFISTSVTIFKIITSLLAAYSFVFFNFKGKNTLYFVLLSTMFIPFTVTMIPNYLTISSWGLGDSLTGVLIPQLADALGIFLLRQSMRGIPRSLIEYAQLEGASTYNIMTGIVIPLIRPNIISTGILFFVNSWNEYVWPVLILKTKSKFTLSLALQMFISSEGGTDFTIAMAVSVMTMIIPITLYLIFQRYILDTFTTSGVK